MADNRDFLRHFGIPGQKWGIRRFQNEDGSLTEEGRQRYLELNRDSARLYNEVADRMNKDLSRINKKYDKVDLNDDRNNLEYTKEIRDMWQKHYRDVLAKDIGTDPSSIKGQKWLNDVFGYSSFDEQVSDLEKKVTANNLTNKVKKNTEKQETSDGKYRIKSEIEDYGEKQKKELRSAYSDKEIKYGVSYYEKLFRESGLFDSNPELAKRLHSMPEDERFYYMMNLSAAISNA